jgi:hypothetical protein
MSSIGPHPQSFKSNLDAALYWAAKGYRVFPIAAGTNDSPTVMHGFKDAVTDEKQIRAWWTENPDYNIGCYPAPSGHFVLDIDNKPGKDGFATLRELEALFGKLPPTMTVRTPSGGCHLWFGGQAPSFQGRADRLGVGLDIRGGVDGKSGGYVLLPPSSRPDGKYTLVRNIEIAKGPDWLVEAAKAPPREAKPGHAPSDKPTTKQRLVAHLTRLDPGVDYDEWRDVVAAIRATVLADGDEDTLRGIAHQWSAGELWKGSKPDNWTGDDAVDRVFDTMLPRDGGVAYGTIVRAARKTGLSYAAETFGEVNPVGEVEDKAMGNDVVLYKPAGLDIFQSDDDEVTDRRLKFRGIKPSEGAKRPKASFWDEDKTLPRYPQGCRGLVVAESSNHKTNLILAKMLDAIRDHGARVVFCAGEAADEFMTERIPAQCEARGITVESLDKNLIVTEACPLLALRSGADVHAIVDVYRDFNPDFLVVDTLSEAITGEDENSAQAASLAMAAAGYIRRALGGCHVILIHHLGKDTTKGGRGSTVYRAGTDFEWIITYHRERRTVEQYVKKMRRGRPDFSVMWGTEIFGDTMTVVPLSPEAKAVATMQLAAQNTSAKSDPFRDEIEDAMRGHRRGDHTVDELAGLVVIGRFGMAACFNGSEETSKFKVEVKKVKDALANGTRKNTNGKSRLHGLWDWDCRPGGGPQKLFRLPRLAVVGSVSV